MFGIDSGYYVLQSGMANHWAGNHVIHVYCAAIMTDRRAGPREMRVDPAGVFITPSLLAGLTFLRVCGGVLYSNHE